MDMIHFEQTDSTNLVAKDLARHGGHHGMAVLAKKQTDGRGRLGRSFFSPEGGLYLSVILRPGLKPEDYPLMTPMAAVAVCMVLEEMCGLQPGIKWVNDVLLNGKKLCGILCEAAGDAVIVGIGLNYSMPEGGFPPEIPATALFAQEHGVISRDRLANAIRDKLLQVLHIDYMEEYRRRSLVVGRQVTVYPVNGESYRAFAVAIDDHGHLVVQTGEGTRALDSGEISIRF